MPGSLATESLAVSLSGWIPRDASGLYAWYRGDYIEQSGGSVTNWVDISGNGLDLAATGTVAYVAADADLGNNPCLTVGDNSNYLEGASSSDWDWLSDDNTAPGPSWWWMAVIKPTSAVVGTIFTTGNGTWAGSQYCQVFYGGQTVDWLQRQSINNPYMIGTSALNGPASGEGGWVGGQRALDGDLTTYAGGGGSEAASATTALSSGVAQSALNIGRFQYARFAGNLAELVIGGGTLSTEDRLNFAAYAANRYGVTA